MPWEPPFIEGSGLFAAGWACRRRLYRRGASRCAASLPGRGARDAGTCRPLHPCLNQLARQRRRRPRKGGWRPHCTRRWRVSAQARVVLRVPSRCPTAHSVRVTTPARPRAPNAWDVCVLGAAAPVRSRRGDNTPRVVFGADGRVAIARAHGPSGIGGRRGERVRSVQLQARDVVAAPEGATARRGVSRGGRHPQFGRRSRAGGP